MSSASLFSLLALGVSAVLAAPVKLVSQDFTSGSVIYDVGGIQYMTPFKTAYASVAGKKVSIEANTPTVALWFEAGKPITKAAILEQLKAYYTADDVLSEGFLSSVLISSSGSASLSKDAMSYLEDLGLDAVFVDSSIKTVPSSKKVKTEKVNFTYKKYDAIEGPFLASPSKDGVSFYPVYRLYVDEFRDFVFGSYPEAHPTGKYIPFLGHSAKFVDPIIPVPSRIYSMRDERPLAGKRIAIKDIYDVAGLQTAAGNRAYTDLYGPANATGPAAQRLLDLGVVVIGKTKTAQYASGESLNDNWLEVQYPFNARGDHWQTCSASSSGSGCAMAAYDWLDLATGSDTGSSMRRPAAVAGVYGNRPSHDIISLEGVVPLVLRQDTLGIFSRDAVLWNKAAHAWYADSPLQLIDYKGVPSKVLYPTDYLPMANPDAEAILQSFLGKLNEHFGMETVYFNFSQTTLESSSPFSNFTAVGAAYSGGGANDGFLDAGLAVIENYKAQNEGRFPPLNPSTRSGWQRSYAAGLGAPTPEAVAAADAVTRDIREWWSNEFLGTNPESCSEGIMIYDIGTRGLPSYREAALNTRFGENGAVTIPVTYNNTVVSPATISPYVGNPDFTIHIGEVDYMSAVTQVMEKLPVSLSIMSNPGCDFMLFNFIEKLQNMGIIKASKTGRTMYREV